MSSTSLPTPPSTSHREREKENRNLRISTGSRSVIWAEEHQYHIVPTSPPHCASLEASASKELPTKSILKRTSHVLLPLDDENQKETTPEPSDPLVDLKYLEGPVSRIVASDAALGDLIEAYSILAARLRASVTAVTDADSSWPLFQPLRKNHDAFVDALVRDLGRALVDPQTVFPDDQQCDHERLSGLPSPQNSPKKKRGMSEQQVKFARDLCTTCHAVIKLLNVMFTMPAVYAVFTDTQLRFVLTQVLAIPLANELPTPNARKTNALAIWLIQTQRLPDEVLAPARDRIAYALRRGIEGELGKEGKKGSAGDGLKAIHDLSMHYPTVFVPAFTDLLPSILSNLLAPTLPMRNQACNALGGFTYALACLPNSELHARVSALIAAHLAATPATPATASPSSQSDTPSKDAALVRTLRTTLAATDPKQAPQGPVWAWLVLAHLVVLLGPAVYARPSLTRQVTALAVLGMRHARSSVRALGCLVWRCMTWTYFRPPLVGVEAGDDSDADVEGESELDEDARVKGFGEAWKVVQLVVDMGAGVATIGALLGSDSTRGGALRRALGVLRAMSKKGGQTCKDALDVATRLVSLAPEPEWRPLKLLVPGLFSALPGLLTAEYKTLSTTVRPLFEETPQLEDIRALTKEELALDWVFEGLLDIWKEGVFNLRLSWGCEVPAEILDVWFGLLQANVLALQDDHDGIVSLAESAVDVLIGILKDRDLELSADSDELSSDLPTSPIKSRKRRPTQDIPASRVNVGLKFYLVNELWLVVKTAFKGITLARPAANLLRFLHRNELNLIEDLEAADVVRKQWAYMCADVALECDVEDLDVFWAQRRVSSRRAKREWSSAVRQVMWQAFVLKWQDERSKWQVAVTLLGVPFIDANAWDMSSADLDVWDGLLQLAVSKAVDVGLNSIDLLERVAGQIWAHHAPTHASSLRVADLLLSHLEVDEAPEVPADLFEFVNDALIVSYPPEPRNKIAAMWLMRTLTRIIDACPLALLPGVLRLAEQGLCIWIKDECKVFTADEYTMDILPLYQTVLLTVQSLSDLPSAALSLLSVVTSTFQGRDDKPTAMLQAYNEFKEALTSCSPCAHSPSVEEALLALDTEQSAWAAVSYADDLAVEADAARDCTSADGDTFTEAEEDEQAQLHSEAQVVQLLLPPLDFLESAPSSPALPIASLPSSPVAGSLELPEPPITPKVLPRNLLSTPTRPRKSAVKELAPQLLKSPSSPLKSSPRRPPTTPKHTPQSGSRRERLSSARRRGASKENLSPLPIIASVTERLAMRSPAAGGPSMLGKRSVFDDELEERVAKRSKLSAASGPSAPVVQDIANTLLQGKSISQEPIRASVYFQEAAPISKEAPLDEPQASSSSFSKGLEDPPTKSSKTPEEPVVSTSSVPELNDPPQTTTATPPRPKKRKAVFMDAVEVPTLREMLRLSRTARSQPESPESSTPQKAQSNTTASSSSQRTLRRTRSTASLSAEPVRFLKLEDTPRKRRKSRLSELLVMPSPSPSPSMSSPLRALRDAPVVGSDDSIMLASPTKHSEPPSDDDIQIGPLGIASPALRRVKSSDFDLPSDDSNMSESPTRDVVARRTVRQPALHPFVPLAVRSRSISAFPLPDSGL